MAGSDHSTRFSASQGPRVVGPRDGKIVNLGGCSARFMVWAEESGGGFSLVEHPIPPGHLAAPVHRHSREDEYSYVIEGRLGAQLGDDLVYAEAGDLVFKPRDQWHTFWNADDTDCRLLEIISPGGFEHYFDELVAGFISPDEQQERYGTETDLERTRQLCDDLGLVFPPPP
ncbi:MAG: cupin domain-containing protein [Streptosporangiaceae bacterium]